MTFVAGFHRALQSGVDLVAQQRLWPFATGAPVSHRVEPILDRPRGLRFRPSMTETQPADADCGTQLAGATSSSNATPSKQAVSTRGGPSRSRPPCSCSPTAP